MKAWLAAAALVVFATNAAAQTPVKIGVFGITAEAGLYIAAGRGYFKQEGLDVEFLPGMVGAEAFPALATGRIDAVGGSFSPGVINAARRGVRVKLVLGMSSYAKDWNAGHLMVRKALVDEGKMRDWKDLKGLTVSVTPARPNLAEYIVSKALAKGGLTFDDVKVVEIPFTSMVSALRTGGIDVAHVSEPQSTSTADSGAAVKWRNAVEYLPAGFTVAILTFGPSLLDAPGVGERLLAAYLHGARDYNTAFRPGGTGRAELIRIMIAHTAVKNPEMYERMGYPYLDPDGTLSMPELNDQAAYFAKASGTEPVDVASLVDDRYRKAAREKIGPYRP